MKKYHMTKIYENFLSYIVLFHRSEGLIKKLHWTFRKREEGVNGTLDLIPTICFLHAFNTSFPVSYLNIERRFLSIHNSHQAIKLKTRAYIYTYYIYICIIPKQYKTFHLQPARPLIFHHHLIQKFITWGLRLSIFNDKRVNSWETFH